MKTGALIHDSSGKLCAAKTAYMVTLGICLTKALIGGMTYGDWSVAPANYEGMAIFLAPIAATYWGRANTKARAGLTDV